MDFASDIPTILVESSIEKTMPQELSVSENAKSDNPLEHEPSGGSINRVQPELSLQLALLTARTAAEEGGTDILALDMTQHTAMFDYFVIITGTSRRQLRAMSEVIEKKIEAEINDKRMNIDSDDDSHWIVLDYGTVIIHLFDEETRMFYSLETLWADAKKLDLTETLSGIRVK